MKFTGQGLRGFVCLSALMLLALFTGPAVNSQQFEPGCQMPFPDATGLAIDASCPAEGDATEPAHRAQNQAKNNFCAVGSPGVNDAIRITVSSFDALQNSAEDLDVPFGSSNQLPPDRSVLQNIATNANGISIGEGSYVVYVGYVMHAKIAGKESVNCHLGTVFNNDTHIHLGNSGSGNLCNSVTAEINPHFRPAEYRRFHYKENVEQLKTRPVRLKGSLFFDASHKPCLNGGALSGHPARRSIWEIHPVYFIDVCKNTSLASCGADDDSKWTPFEEWIHEQ